MPVDITRPKRARKFRIEEIAAIISTFKRMTQTENRGIQESCKLIAAEYDRTWEVVYALIRRFQPAVDGAEAYIKANTLKLAMRVVRKANVDQSIDILSRSNIGVLAPKQEGGGGTGGFFLSVQAENLGAVRVTAGMAPGSPQRFADLPQPLEIEQADSIAPPSAPYSGASGHDDTAQGPTKEDRAAVLLSTEKVDLTQPGVPHPGQGSFRRGLNQDHQDAIAKAKERLAEARRDAQLAHNRDVGL